MTPPLDWQPEPFFATGGSSAEGIKNQLGRPRMDPLEVLVREAVQNSWDARADESGGVFFGISCWTATPDQSAFLRDVVLTAHPSDLGITEHLSAQGLLLLALYDRGTVGLGGPTRADYAPPPGERTDFIDFLRAVGQPRDHEFGGGTYGFGKAAFYVNSLVRTICIHTRCRSGGVLESRFMGAALGPQHTSEESGRRYTGRHWWGRQAEDGIVDPVVGSAADDIAGHLGLPPFGADETGTTILLVAPNFRDKGAEAAMALIRQSLLSSFWPKMVDGADGGATIVFGMELEGAEVSVPHPDSVPGLRGFVDAFSALRTSQNSPSVYAGTIQPIASQRPAMPLGRMSLVKYPLRTHSNHRDPTSAEIDPVDDPLAGPAHHTAVMRAPHFVVRYIEGPPIPFNQAEYAGVFVVDRSVDAVFAESEPPTHDDWVPDGLANPTHRTFVRTALRRIKEAMAQFAAPPPARSSVGTDVPLGSFADQLGGLVAAEVGTGAAIPISAGRVREADAGTNPQPGHASTAAGGGAQENPASGVAPFANRGSAPPSGPSGEQPRRRVRPGTLSVIGGQRIEIVAGQPALVIDFEVSHEAEAAVLVAAEAGVIIEGGALEIEAPAGSLRPEVLEWRGPNGAVYTGEAQCQIEAEHFGQWSVAVSIPSDAMISVSLRLA